MTPYTILAPGLERDNIRLLKVAMQHAKLPWPETGVSNFLPVTSSRRFVLSVGKVGLDTWHEYGLIQVQSNHGDVFVHHGPNGGVYEMMVVEHPSSMGQQSAFVKYSAREDMLRNLQRFAWLLRGGRAGEFVSKVCGGCMAAKGRIVIEPAEHWVPELDGVGLCDFHYRKRSQYRVKGKRVRRADLSKAEHQMPGQLEMMPGDGTKVQVYKS